MTASSRQNRLERYEKFVEKALSALSTFNEDSDYGPCVNVTGSNTVCNYDEKYYMNSTEEYDNLNAQNVTMERKREVRQRV